MGEIIFLTSAERLMLHLGAFGGAKWTHVLGALVVCCCVLLLLLLLLCFGQSGSTTAERVSMHLVCQFGAPLCVLCVGRKCLGREIRENIGPHPLEVVPFKQLPLDFAAFRTRATNQNMLLLARSLACHKEANKKGQPLLCP